MSQKSRLNPEFQLNTDDLRNNTSITKYLNDKDRDILFLIFISNKRQKAVQNILRRSQPSLCYDIKRIKERIEFILYLQQVSDIFLEFIEEHQKKYDKDIIDILVLMFHTTSYTHTAEILGMKQISVRYIYEKTLKKMRELGHWDVYEIFSNIRRNKNKVRRTYSKPRPNKSKNNSIHHKRKASK